MKEELRELIQILLETFVGIPECGGDYDPSRYSECASCQHYGQCSKEYLLENKLRDLLGKIEGIRYGNKYYPYMD